MRPRLILRPPINDLEEFGIFTREAAQLSDDFDVRVVVGQLAHKDYRALRWPDDPYIQYSCNVTSLFNLVQPEELKGLLDQAFIQENRALMRKKVDTLSAHGISGAIFLREPVYMPEEVFERFPDWRGPRIDHPRRSRHPLFSLCFHHPQVEDLYRRAVRSLCTDFPEVDTWLAMTNDSGSGFCWSVNLYNGPNGPSSCRSVGAPPAIAAYHRALIEGSREAGVEAVSISAGGLRTEDRLRARPLLPDGAYIMPDDDIPPRSMGIGSVAGATMPIRHLSNPLHMIFEGARSSQVEELGFVFCNFGQPYLTDYMDLESTRLDLTLFKASRRLGKVDFRGALDLLCDTLAAFYGREAAPSLTEGYRLLYEIFRLQRTGGLLAHLAGPLYGTVSTRWLTRPLVAFQEELAEEETSYYMPHIFNARGIEGRRDLLDVHGMKITGVADRGPEWSLRNGWYEALSDGLGCAADAFERSDVERGETLAKAARLLGCIWRTCRNTVEFALLRERACEKPLTPKPEPGVGDEDRQRVYEVLRDEIDNIRRFLNIWGTEDSERVVTLAREKKDEYSFLFGPDLREQLEKKIRIMISRWEDVERLYAPPNL